MQVLNGLDKVLKGVVFACYEKGFEVIVNKIDDTTHYLLLKELSSDKQSFTIILNERYSRMYLTLYHAFKTLAHKDEQKIMSAEFFFTAHYIDFKQFKNALSDLEKTLKLQKVYKS